MQNIWFTSDTHFSHKNIVAGVSEWRNKDGSLSAGTRAFDTLEEHNQTLIDNINRVVKEEDILYHMGDWSFGGIEQIAVFRRALRCKRIHLTFGNHDHHILRHKRFQDMFEHTDHVRYKNIGGEPMFLSHYSHRVWPEGHKGRIHLYGHSHGNLEDYQEPIYGAGDYDPKKYRCMDVGIDTHPEFRPYELEEILVIMEDRIPCFVDHHDPSDPH